MAALVLAALAVTGTAQEAPTPSPTPPPVAPFAAAEVVEAADGARRLMGDIAARSDDPGLERIDAELDRSAALIQDELVALDGDLAAVVTIPQLEDLRWAWNRRREELGDLSRALAQRAAAVDADRVALREEATPWAATVEDTAFADLPQALQEVVVEVRHQLEAARTDAGARLEAVASLQSRTAELVRAVDGVLARLAAATEARRREMLATGDAPLWRALGEPGTKGLRGAGAQLGAAAVRTGRGFLDYLRGAAPRVAIQLGFLLALYLFLRSASLRPTGAGGAAAIHSFPILRRPAAASLILAVMLGGPLLHQRAPSAWRGVMLLLLLTASARLLLVVLPSTLRGTILSIAALGLVHWTAVLVPEVHLLDRLLWLAAAVIGMVVVPRAAGSAARVLGLGRPLWRSLALGGARLGVVLLAGGAVLEILGVTLLAETLVNGVLFGLYFAVVFRTAVEVVAQTVDVFLEGRVARRSRTLHRYRTELRAAVRRSATALAFVGWLAGTLSAFLLLTPVVRTVGRLLSASVSLGAVEISVGDVLVFAVAVWLSFAVSRLIRSVLEAELLSRITLPQGAPQALSTLTHWAVLLLGLLLALGLVGIDITSFALLAGALGVGIGFGLQNVVNNFVSGLILLFERPIRVGDKIQLGQLGGEVTSIGIRASTVRTWEGAEVVVPNGNLISNEIFNWTLSDPRRRLEIPIGVAYGTDPGRMLELLVTAAGTVPQVLADPAPYALFTGFGDSSLDFELRAWCHFDDSLPTQTALRVAIVRALAEAEIEIPFPQRDLHLRSVTDAAGEKLSPQER